MDRGATGFGSAWRGGCGRHGIGQGRAAVARRADRPKQIARYLRCAPPAGARGKPGQDGRSTRSEEHTSELQSLMRISYAVFCLKKKKKKQHITNRNNSKVYRPSD